MMADTDTTIDTGAEAGPETAPASSPASSPASTSVNTLADLGTIAGDAPQGDAAVIAQRAEVPLREQQLDKQGRAYATGRRKDAVARVWLKPGSGKITVNGRDSEVYFARPTLRLADSSGPKSGRLNSSIGVGTVTI